MEKMNRISLSVLAAVMALSLPTQLLAGITSVNEVGLDGDTPALVGTDFGEDSLTFSDRTHQHNGAAFDEGGVLVTPTGPNIVGLPDYLLGNDYVLFANNARDNGAYVGTVTTDAPSIFYLLIDNRINGPESAASSPNTNDPVLGGSLQWVIDGGWQRVNTGISPNGQADYTGVDESGDGVGPGQGLNQFYAVYTMPGTPTSVDVSSNGTGGSNMIALVAAPAPGTDKVPSMTAWGFMALVGALLVAAAALLRRRAAPAAA